MAVHKIFRGDRTRCAQLYPMARSKLDILRKVLLSSGQSSASQRFDLTTGEIVMIYVNGTEEYIYITAGGDGYYCLGDLGGSESYISASPTARGAFAPRGEFRDNELSVPNLFYVGRGKGVVPVSGGFGISEFYETRNAVTYTRVLAFAYVTGAPGNVWQLVPSAVAYDGEDREQSYGVATSTSEDDEIYATYFYTLDGANSWNSRITGYGNGIEVGVPSISRVGPRSLFMFVPAYKGDNNPSPQWSYVQVSHNNGQSWTSQTSGDLITDLTDATVDNESEFNQELAALSSSLYAIRLHNDNRDILLIVRSSILNDDSNAVRIYHADPDTGLTTFVLQQPDVGEDPPTVGYTPLVVQDVPMYAIAPPEADNPKILFVGNIDGTSWIQRPMPWPAHSTGVIKAINERTVVCPAYNPENGYYELYQTEDLGQSWQFRATIRTDAPPPDEDFATLLRFGVLSILRQRGRPANSFPGQPWVGDNRITPPGA